MSENNNIPKHWQVKKLGEVCKLKNGYAFKSDNYINEGVPVIRISDIKGGIVSSKKAVRVFQIEEYENYIIENNDILVAMSGATTGKFGIYKSTEKAYQNQRVGKFKIFNETILDNQFLFHHINALKRQIEKDAYGGAQPNISSNKIEQMEIVLPPLPEQHAIVTKIEELFSNLENGKQQLQTAQQQLKVYRQSLLKWAFEGKLTEKWRNQSKESYSIAAEPRIKYGSKNELPEGWKKVKIEDIATIGTGATPLKGNSKYYEGGKIAWVTSGALNDEFVREATDFVTELALKTTNLSVYPKHTLLLAMYGEGKTRGKCSELLIEATTNQAIAAIHFENRDERIRPFLKYFLLKNYNDIRMLSSGGVQPNLNLGIVKKTIIPLPPFEEQQFIVSELESKLTICDKIEETISQNLQQAEALRQSILKRAFEGKLI
ncbi:MAG: restriction endonuclease subunit S [bacterium]